MPRPNATPAGAPPMPNAQNAGAGRNPGGGGQPAGGNTPRPRPANNPRSNPPRNAPPRNQPAGGAAAGGGAAAKTTRNQAARTKRAAGQTKTRTAAAGGGVVTKTTTRILPATGTTTGTAGTGTTTRAKKTQAPPPSVGGAWFKRNWKGLVLGVILLLALAFALTHGGAEKVARLFSGVGSIGSGGSPELSTSVMATPGGFKVTSSTNMVIGNMPTTLTMASNSVAVFGIVYGDIVNGDNFGYRGAGRSENPAVPAPKPTPTPTLTPAAPVKPWPHDGSQPSITVETMSPCDALDLSKITLTNKFVLKAHSDVNYHSPGGFKADFKPSDETKLDKALNVGSKNAPIWMSKAEYLADGNGTSSSTWYKNRGNTDVIITIEFTRQ